MTSQVFRSRGWRSGESTRLPPMWPGFKSWRRGHMWVEFVVGSLLCSERFFSGYSGFPSPQKPTFLNSNSTRNQVDQETLSFFICYLFRGGRGGRRWLKSPNSRYPPSLRAFKNWWDKSNVAWFLRRQISDKICQLTKSRLSLFILDNRKWRTDEMTITASYGWK